MPKGKSGIKRNGGKTGLSKGFKEGVTYTATAGYKQEMIADPNGKYYKKGDATHTSYKLVETFAENKQGYLAVRKAEEGSRVTVHYPEYPTHKGVMKAHDEYYEVRRMKYGDGSISKHLYLEYMGSSLPGDASLQITTSHRLEKTSGVREFLGLSDRITVYAPQVKAKSYEEQKAEIYAENAKKYGWKV